MKWTIRCDESTTTVSPPLNFSNTFVAANANVGSKINRKIASLEHKVCIKRMGKEFKYFNYFLCIKKEI